MKGKPITHFMWRWQHLFRSNLDWSASSLLRSIGAGVDPRAYLVGFAANETANYPWCVEPETEPLAEADLSGVADRARQLYEAHEDFSLYNSDPRTHQNRHRWLQNKARAQALGEALGASPYGAGLQFFVGTAVHVADYEVHPVVSVLASRWDALPTLTTNRRDRIDIQTSLQHAVVHALLRAASAGLDRADPEWFERDEAELLRRAANDLVYSAAVLSGQIMAHRLLDALDAVAAQPYEGRSGFGTVILASPTDGAINTAVPFSKAVSVDHVRAFRKVLEMSGPDLHVLCDGRDIYGLGRLSGSYDPATESTFEIRVVGRGSWELAHGGSALLRIDNTRPALPREKLSAADFADTASRLFPESTEQNITDLWALAQAAAEQAHGTMLVVHHDAATEAVRLEPQSLRIEPTQLDLPTLRALTNIDGAVLLSPDARCHAAGVILDGQATGTGDAARGARYNSAVRYERSASTACLLIIVSEDGMIDLLPSLRRRIARSTIERLVDEHEAASRGIVNFEAFHRHDARLVALEFYLNAEQCTRANAAREQVNQQRGDSIRIIYREFEPHPDMNDTYLL